MAASAGVRLRDVSENELATFFEHQSDPDANRMANFEARDREAFFGHCRKILRDRSVVVRAVEFEGRLAGNIVSWEHDGERDVGYWIGREHWGKGIATAALSAFLSELATRSLRARRHPQRRIDPGAREVRLPSGRRRTDVFSRDRRRRGVAPEARRLRPEQA